MPYTFIETNKGKNYTIETSIVDDKFNNIEVFLKSEAAFSSFSQQVTNYYDAKVIGHVPDYNFDVTKNEKELSFTFANDLEDSLKFLKGLRSISQNTYDIISNCLKIYNRSASTTENEINDIVESTRRFTP